MKIAFFVLALFCAACTAPQADHVSRSSYHSVYWSDGDSGRLGDLKFRLSNVDAPETGGVGARGGAKCEYERELGYEAKAYVVELTRGTELAITGEYGEDRYGRLVVDLSADGIDVGRSGVEAGHLGDWPHKGSRALQKKPDWCAKEPK